MLSIINHPPSRSALFALGLLVGIAIVLLPQRDQAESHASMHDDHYGNALAKSAAREAVEATFRKDLISLSAIAESVANNPRVEQVNIYDIEGRVLVQAGLEKHLVSDSAQTYQTTIAMQDSAAGVVAVTLAPLNWQGKRWQPIYFLIMLIAFAYLVWRLYVDNFINIKSLTKNWASNHEANENDDALTLPSEALLDDDNESDAEPEVAYAALCIKNVGVLQQQLNGETFRKTFNQVEQKLNKIGQLYGALDCHWEQDRYFIKFGAAQESEALFNAACAAKLMLDLAGITNRIPLDLAAQISLQKQNTLQDDMPFVGLAVHEVKDAFSLLKPRTELLEISEDDASRRLISAFSPPYADLLKKQMAQLSDQIN